MSDLKAKVIKQFLGVPDGEIYPRGYIAGDEVVGDLAKVAIEEGWAEKMSGDAPPRVDAPLPIGVVTETAPQGLTTASIVAEAVKPAIIEAAAVIEIPDEWKSMKWFALKVLAEKIAGREVKDSDDAKAIVETELGRRSPS